MEVEVVAVRILEEVEEQGATLPCCVSSFKLPWVPGSYHVNSKMKVSYMATGGIATPVWNGYSHMSHKQQSLT